MGSFSRFAADTYSLTDQSVVWKTRLLESATLPPFPSLGFELESIWGAEWLVLPAPQSPAATDSRMDVAQPLPAPAGQVRTSLVASVQWSRCMTIERRHGLSPRAEG